MWRGCEGSSPDPREGNVKCPEMNGHDDEKHILYDMLVPVEWPEITIFLATNKGLTLLWRSISAAVNDCLRVTLDKLQHPFSSSSCVPSAVIKLLNAQLPWKLALTSDSTVIAVLRDDVIEIRTLLDGFERVNASIIVSSDSVPQWRQILWNDEGSLLAYGTSCGVVQLFSSSGSSLGELGNTLSKEVYKNSLEPSLANMAFLPPQRRSSGDVLSLLCLLLFDGTLDTYEIRSTGPVFLHSFLLASYLPKGVCCMTYSTTQNLLLVGGCPHEEDGCGISGWRLLDAAPYWGPRLGQQIEKTEKGYFSRLFPGRNDSLKHPNTVFSMSLNPPGTLLATLDISGNISLWEIPSFRRRVIWNYKQLPSKKSLDEEATKVSPLLIQTLWWSDEALILSNEAGEVSVLSIHSLKSLLSGGSVSGWSPTPATNEQFFLLECETRYGTLVDRSRLPSLSEGSEEETEDQNQTEYFSLSQFSSNLVKQVLYFITDSERFRLHNKKKIRTLTKKYQLACVKAITPAECYERKLQSEKYDEALELAEEYGLDCDLVYQRQWQNYVVTSNTIQEYLSKVSKRSWVLQECLNRSTDDYITTRCLLEYGLERTSFRELMSEMEEESSIKLSADIRKELVMEELEKIEKLSLEQISICRFRYMLLCYLDRLETYEVILSEPTSVFESTEYEKFRSDNLVPSAITYARESNWRALRALFTYHGETLLPHRLAILSNFPETTSPQKYSSLLPVISVKGDLIGWEQKRHREQDWVETEVIKTLCSLPDDTGSNTADFIYQENRDWIQYMNASSVDIIQHWYVTRATEIEEFSGQVDCALTLIRLGMENGIQGLSDIHHDLKTLCTLVYECNVDSRFSLKKLKVLSDLEVMELMMKETGLSESEFVSGLERYVLPFLERLETIKTDRSRGLLKEYLNNLTKEGLEPCLSVLQQSNNADESGGDMKPILSTMNDRIELAISCIYGCNRNDQLEVANEIVQCLPMRTVGSLDVAHLHDRVDLLEKHISAADILSSYGVNKSIRFLSDVQGNLSEAKQLMVLLTRVASRRQNETAQLWKKLLEDLLDLQSSIFDSIDQVTCYKIYIQSLLCSGKESNIILASSHLTLSLPLEGEGDSTNGSKVQTDQAVGFKLSYSLSVELVVDAAREYFNSAADGMDKEMNLARTCLYLFPSPGVEVQNELNLIASLALLDDFNVSMLPVQVRLSENKLDIVRSILDSSPTAYKSYFKILELCRLLNTEQQLNPEEISDHHFHCRASEMTEDQGHSIILIILAALEKKDYKLALHLSSQLMEAQFSPAWEISRVMAMDGHVGSYSSRMKLLDFSITHCPAEEISLLLQSKQVLQLQIRCSECDVGSSTAVGVASSHDGNQGLVGRSVKQLVSKGAGAVQQLMKSRAPLAEHAAGMKSSQHMVMECLLSLKPHTSMTSESTEYKEVKLCLHPFYQTKPVELSSKSLFSYNEPTRVFVDKPLSIVHTILYGTQVANTMNQALECKEVLLKLSELSCENDVHILLGNLLSLHKHEDLDVWISRVTSSKFSLEMAIYYICLNLYNITTLDIPSATPPYKYPPTALMSHMSTLVKSRDVGGWTAKQKPWVDLLLKYEQLLKDHTQAEVLRNLGLGIDIAKFTHSNDYKHEVIIEKLSSDLKFFSTALSLGRRHGVDLWKIHMSLLNSLLTTKNLGIKEVEKKLEEQNMMRAILENPQKSVDFLREHTYTKLFGKNYEILLLYYSIIQECVNTGAEFKEAVSVDVHIKILKKLKSAVHGLDYKLLMSAKKDPLLLLAPVLYSTNVHVVAKLANRIPCSDNTTLTPGMVFCTFAIKLFWKRKKKSSPTSVTTDWLECYDMCQEYIDLLNPAEFQHFVLEISCCEKALQLSIDTRCDLLEKSISHCKKSAASGRSTGKSAISYKELEVVFEGYLRHIRNLNHPDLQITKLPEDVWKNFMRKFDLSLSQAQKVHSLVMEMIFTGISPDIVNIILELASSVESIECSTSALYKEALFNSLAVCSEGDSPNTDQLELIMHTISEHEINWNPAVVTSNDILSVLRPYCSDPLRPLPIRKKLFVLIEKYLTLSEEDHHLLLFYQTQYLLANITSTAEIDINDVSDPISQRKLFSSLLSKFTSSEKLMTFCTLLDCWCEYGGSSLVECWVDLLECIATKADAIGQVVFVRAGLTGIPLQVDEKIFTGIYDRSVTDAVKYSLLCENDCIFKKTIIQLQEMDPSFCKCDKDLLELLVYREKALFLRTVNSPLYHYLQEYLKDPHTEPPDRQLFARFLHCSESDVAERLFFHDKAKRLKNVAHQLYDGGFIMEAGTLVISAQSFHSEVSTLSDSLAFIKGLFST